MKIVLISTIITLSVCMCDAQWVRASGPWSPNISCFAASGTNIFAGAYEGVFLSTDNGASWNATGLDTSVNALAVSGMTLLAGSFEGGLFLTTNGGNTWKPINNGLPNYPKIMSVAVIDSHLFAGSGAGVFRSTNMGAGWSAANSGLEGSSVNTLLAVGSKLFAATGSGTYRTTDYGATWVHADSGLSPNLSALAVLDSTLFAGHYYDGVLLSTNYGVTWTPVGLSDARVVTIGVSNTGVFAGTRGNGVFLTTDEGTNWTPINDGLTIPYVRALGVSENSLLASTLAGLFRTSDGGTRWDVISRGLPFPVRAIAMQDGDLFAGIGWSGGREPCGLVFRSRDDGASWSPQISFLDPVTEFCAKEGFLFAGMYRSVYRSFDQGTTWASADSGLPDPPEIYTLCASAPDAPDPGNLFAGTGSNGVFLSTNNGTSWTAINDGLPLRDSADYVFVSCLAASEQNLFAGTGDSGVYLSTNSGTNWRAVNNGLPVNTYVTALAGIPNGDGSIHLLAGTSAGVYRTTDNGATWSAANAGMPASAVNTFAVTGTNIFAGIWYQGVYLSTNGGTTWTEVNSGLVDPSVTCLTTGGTHLYAGTESGLWKRPISDMVTTVSHRTDQTPNTFSLEQNYPNPFNPGTIIRYQLPMVNYVSLKVYDLLGREVATLVNEVKLPGSYTVEWNASGLASGVYFYRLRAGDFADVKKLVVLR
jgi:hypothetical protein